MSQAVNEREGEREREREGEQNELYKVKESEDSIAEQVNCDQCLHKQ